MKRPQDPVARALALAAMGVLLASVAAAEVPAADTAGEARAARQVSAGGCCGCCAGAAADDSGPRCGRGGDVGCCRAGRGPRHGHGGGMGHGMRRGPGHGPGGGMGPGARRGPGGGPVVMQTVRALVHDYRHEIERRVEDVEKGVVTVTRAPGSEPAAAAIRRHVREMKGLLEEGGRVRLWDPLFREIFAHADEISLEIEELEDGMRVTETSDNPRVVALIRAHARKVNEFVDRGPAAVHQETPLPRGYAAGE